MKAEEKSTVVYSFQALYKGQGNFWDYKARSKYGFYRYFFRICINLKNANQNCVYIVFI
jgi:hypothetical protein